MPKIPWDVIQLTESPKRDGTRSKNIKHILFGEQEGLCNGCGELFHIRNLTIDHKEPTSKGGPDIDDNKQLLCGACNSMKGDRKCRI